MAPGIMFLGGMEQDSSNNNTEAGAPVLLTEPADPNRPDSPGYFTLSDSDGNSSNPPNSPVEVGGCGQKTGGKNSSAEKKQPVYKMFHGKSSKTLNARPNSHPGSSNADKAEKRKSSKQRSSLVKTSTPPRPLPPKGYSSNNNSSSRNEGRRSTSIRSNNEPLPPKIRNSGRESRGTPPRPPPPLGYASTLPPPVPKKKSSSTLPSKRTSQNYNVNRNSNPINSKVQPLQIQSPSVIKMLTAEEKPAKKQQQQPTTFVQAFQKANKATKVMTTTKAASPVRRDSNSSVESRQHLSRRSSSSSVASTASSKAEKAIKKTSESAKKSIQTARTFLSKKNATISMESLKRRKSCEEEQEIIVMFDDKSKPKTAPKSLSSTAMDKIRNRRRKSEENSCVISTSIERRKKNDANIEDLSIISGHNPAEDSKDLSITEIDVLDQYISQMISLTEEALSEDADKKEEFVSLIEEVKRNSKDEVEMRQSVKEIIRQIEESNNNNVNIKSPPRHKKLAKQGSLKVNKIVEEEDIISSSDKVRSKKTCEDELSEDQISRGVFTEVSYAGSFSSSKQFETQQQQPLKAPIPSPRTKRKARKEQMLLEHKMSGKEALNLLKSKTENNDNNRINSENIRIVESPNCDSQSNRSLSSTWQYLDTTNSKGLVINDGDNQSVASKSSGLQCLDELCCQSEKIQRDLQEHQQQMQEHPVEQLGEDEKKVKEHLGKRSIFL